ncbi:AAA-like domain-containing protein [Nostoc sp. LEGE 12447]|uniref:eIF2A-related protein n=1 Tax=Nostoc sp. LEGE 12447 TaxID=1828640 RepID=UPI00188385B0|nr:AAA-like domain-containing protein [Nostoc sp. LEGE 12447]MBE9001854.1 AAA-like domain-containing protein [Nostoc sp. LEGE 12447]
MHCKYEVNATLSENSPTYVRRKADDQLYNGLKAGNFCYVFNARKTGKSSLRVQVMNRLKKEEFACSVIDISGKNTRKTNLEQWYAGILNDITKDFHLDINLRSWIKERDWLSPLDRFKEFIESILLLQICQNIVIFIDEIDSVLSLDFPSDDFFAFIRACHNRRVDASEYNRLTFCLLGVATPSDLIVDKKRTPFNIGQAIELTGFTLEEAKLSLIQGLVGKVDNPQAVLKEVLEWTEGQPFLTQKLCQLIVDKTESSQPNIGQLVHKYIIENWQSQDEPEHLKTIRDRMTTNEQRAGRWLGLYQQILLQGEVVADDSYEQATMRLSGLVIKKKGRLKIYNRIYQCVFNLSWVEKELAKLRPYAEAFKAWVDSGYTDESRLLRGQALNDALAWSANKSLSDRDYQFLTASQELEKREIQRARELEKLEAEINLEAERKKLEAQEKANNILKAATQKANRLIRIGTGVLGVTLAIAALVGIWLAKSLAEAQEAKRIEMEGNRAISKFEFQEIQALLSAMQAGQDLQTLVKDKRSLEKYPTTSPILALQTILYNIREHTQLKGHRGAVRTASFSPNGQRIITASTDKTAKVWDLSGKVLVELRGHRGGVRSASFSPDGQRIVTASTDKTAKVWDASGNLLVTIAGHQSRVTSANFSPNGQRIVTASEDRTAKVWDLSGRLLTTLKGHQKEINSASFSPNGQRIVTASTDNTAKVWDLSGKLLTTLNGHGSRVNSASFSPNGQHIITASHDNKANIWNLSGKLLKSIDSSGSYVFNASFSPDGQRIIMNNIVRNLSGDQLASLPGHTGWVINASFSPNGQHIVTASLDNTAKIWDLSGKQRIVLKGHNLGVINTSFSPNGQHIVTTSWDKTAKVWDLSGKLLTTLQGHSSGVTSANFSPNGQHIVTASEDRTAKVWDLSGKLLTTLQGHSSVVTYASFNPDGQRIVTASWDKTAKVWDLSGKLLTTLQGHQREINSSIFSPDGQRIVTASWDETAKVWDLSGKLLITLYGHEGWVFYASFSPDGKHFTTASNDGTAKIWDSSGKLLVTLAGHPRPVRTASFSPKGQMIVTASDDHTAKIWDLSGRLLGTLTGHQNSVWRADFSPDEQRVVTASLDNTARVWKVENFDQLLQRGCNWLNDYLVTHPADLKKLKICQNNSNIRVAAKFLVKEGEGQAREGKLDNAIATLRQALHWNPKLSFEPTTKVKELTEASALIKKGENLAEEGNIKGAVAVFQKVLKLDPSLAFHPETQARYLMASKLIKQGENLVQAGKVDDAVAVFQKALKLDRSLNIEPKIQAASTLFNKGENLLKDGKIKEAIAAYIQIQKLAPNFEISANSWNSLCWQGSLKGYASDVMYACEKAVALAPNDGGIRDSRGLARALTGNNSGAIEDFQVYIAQTDDKDKKLQRQRWVNALRNQKNPFIDHEFKLSD